MYSVEKILVMPINGIKKPKPYYAPNEEVVIRNEVEAFPAATVTCSYTNCPNYPSLEESYTENLPVGNEMRETTQTFYKLHYFWAFLTLLLHLHHCYIVNTLSLHYYCIVVTLLLHYFYTVVTVILHYCYAIVTFLLHYY